MALPPVAEVSSSQASVASVASAASVAAAIASTGISAELLAAARAAGQITLPAVPGANKGPSTTRTSTTSLKAAASAGSLPLAGRAPGAAPRTVIQAIPGPAQAATKPPPPTAPLRPQQPTTPRQQQVSPRTSKLLSPQRLASQQRLREQIAALNAGGDAPTIDAVLWDTTPAVDGAEPPAATAAPTGPCAGG